LFPAVASIDRGPQDRAMSIRQISAVTLFVTDMARSCGFYRGLGFELKFGGEEAGFSSFHAGAGFLNLNAGDNARPGGGLTIFHVDDVDALHTRALAAGLQPDFKPADAPWGERYFHIHDPDGYTLSFATPLADYRKRQRVLRDCVGIDGCPAGWVAVSHEGAFVDADLANLLNRLAPAVVAIDMPIGLAEAGPRACEGAARRLLGWARSSSVFPVPVRAALTGRTHDEASDLNAAACGKRLSAQTFNILGKIREVDDLLHRSDYWAARVYESHPEVCFTAMNAGHSLAEPKRSATGHARRRELIAAHFGQDAFANARTLVAKKDAADDDIADAFACLFTAERIATDQHVTLPDAPEIDTEGLPMRIIY
jgi:predicted RNase H-like nuclease/catechol 2,3-dioxygenase-like lactoylglutathione lyase family enzyme